MATIILGDIVEVIKETVHNPQESGFQYFVGLEHYDSGEPLITRYATPDNLTSSVKHFAKGDILVARRNVYLKRASLVDFEGVTSGDSIVLRAKDKKYQQILPFILNSDDFWDYAEQNSDGTMSKRLSPAELLDYEFEEPENIELLADKLWATYRVKESYKKLLAATDDMLKAKFQEMFGRLEKNSIVKDIANVVSGKSIPTKYEDIVGNIAYVKVADFNISGNEKYITTSSRFVTVEHANLSKYISPGSVLFAKNGAAALSNKKRLTLIDCCIDMNTMAIIPMKDKICPEYLLSIFENTNIEDYVRQGAIPSISPKDIENMAIYLPPLPLQQQFVEIATQAEATKESLRKSIENIDQVIKSLINQ